MENSVLLQNVTPKQLAELITESVRYQLQELKRDLQRQDANDELLTREQACQFLQINSSTLWAWTNKGKVTAYGIANRRYYKRSELLDCLQQLKK